MSSSFLFIVVMLILPVQTDKVVTTASGTEEVIMNMAREAVQQKFAGQTFRFELSPRWIPRTLQEVSSQQIEAVQPLGPIEKYTSFQVVYRGQHGPDKTEIQLKISAEQKVPVTNRRIMAGEKIMADDLRWQWVPVTLGRTLPIANMQRLTGKTLRRTLNPGQYLTRDYLSTGYVVEAGEAINLVYQANGLQINMTCETRQDGAIDDEIQIYCKETRNKYLAKILGPGEAEWLKTH